MHRLFVLAGLLIGGLVVGLVVNAAISKDANVSYNVIQTTVQDINLTNVQLALGDIEATGGPAKTGSFDMVNIGNVALTGIVVAAVNAPTGAVFTFTCTGGCGTLGLGATKTVGVSLTCTDCLLGAKLHPINVSVP